MSPNWCRHENGDTMLIEVHSTVRHGFIWTIYLLCIAHTCNCGHLSLSRLFHLPTMLALAGSYTLRICWRRDPCTHSTSLKHRPHSCLRSLARSCWPHASTWTFPKPIHPSTDVGLRNGRCTYHNNNRFKTFQWMSFWCRCISITINHDSQNGYQPWRKQWQFQANVCRVCRRTKCTCVCHAIGGWVCRLELGSFPQGLVSSHKHNTLHLRQLRGHWWNLWTHHLHTSNWARTLRSTTIIQNQKTAKTMKDDISLIYTVTNTIAPPPPPSQQSTLLA